MNFKYNLLLGAAAASLLGTSAQAVTVINLVDQGGVAGSQAEHGFNIAAAYWSSLLTNNATINLGVSFAGLAPNVIGSTGSLRQDFRIVDWQNGVNATRSTSLIDQTAVLPGLTGGHISGLTTGVNGNGDQDITWTEFLQNKTSGEVLYANSSVIKAVGRSDLVNPNALDGEVTFSSNFSFDFDPTDGISAGTFDFIGVAIHEIGHALGFVSGVDFLDVYSAPNGPGAGLLGYNLNDTSLFSALDMFRYSAPGIIDLRAGGVETYFSLDGGASALFGNTFSTGRYNGDGNQASHWKDLGGCSGQLGIMDPNFCFGQMGEITGLDLASYDAMGWNLSTNALSYGTVTTADIFSQFGAVPEPATWLFMIFGFGAIGGAMRRQRKANVKVSYA